MSGIGTFDWMKDGNLAIANAVGIDLDELPVTPDRVVEALVEKRRKARRNTLRKVAS